MLQLKNLYFTLYLLSFCSYVIITITININITITSIIITTVIIIVIITIFVILLLLLFLFLLHESIRPEGSPFARFQTLGCCESKE